jgi:hypothetical protein
MKFCARKLFTIGFLIWPGWPAVYILYVFSAVASMSSGPTGGIAQGSPGGAAWHKDSMKVPKSTSGGAGRKDPTEASKQIVLAPAEGGLRTR